MANARLIAKSISTSKRWNQLPSWLSKTLYMLLIIHSDDYGILDGDAEEIKWKVLPAVNEKVPEIEKALQEIRNSGLINRYEWQGHSLIEINQFDANQQGLHKRTARKYPSLKDLQESGEAFREIPGNSGNFPLIRLDKIRLDMDSEGIVKGNNQDSPQDMAACAATPKKKKRTGFPTDFEITPDIIQWVQEHAPTANIEEELRKFQNYHISKGNIFADWKRAFYSWIDNSLKYRSSNNGNSKQCHEPRGLETIRKMREKDGIKE